ncbi:Pre-mRNA-splicing factor CWC26 [Wickerhamiella sorbophila]|uniref:Pre-mRNA-splicing factor CWC26 n=1 Tax=Wickerhamiella sorbophila TaxID=45607 RepID=A0A2T0FHN9_9ASCO|nr:Pre-mRNA-splicing factor CWC26 [Wickerhamiella sorbophila]PRT54495.1 Pre-mRNA-splicing factor CWC26 [Wickerhamiella sorbophila]
MGLAEYLAANYGDENTKKLKGERPKKRRKSNKPAGKPLGDAVEEAPPAETVYRDDQGRKIVNAGLAKEPANAREPTYPTALNKYATDISKDRARLEDPMAAKAEVAETVRVAGVPQYNGPFPPNRFGIAPSYKWDGIDRSNGFEEKWLRCHST